MKGENKRLRLYTIYLYFHGKEYFRLYVIVCDLAICRRYFNVNTHVYAASSSCSCAFLFTHSSLVSPWMRRVHWLIIFCCFACRSNKQKPTVIDRFVCVSDWEETLLRSFNNEIEDSSVAYMYLYIRRLIYCALSYIFAFDGANKKRMDGRTTKNDSKVFGMTIDLCDDAYIHTWNSYNEHSSRFLRLIWWPMK